MISAIPLPEGDPLVTSPVSPSRQAPAQVQSPPELQRPRFLSVQPQQPQQTRPDSRDLSSLAPESLVVSQPPPQQQQQQHYQPPQRPKLSPTLHETIDIDPCVPMLVRRCIEYLLPRKAMETEGIFRVPGNLKEMKDLKTRCEREGDVNLSVCRDPLTVAGLLKLYFRETLGFPVSKPMTKQIIEIWSNVIPPSRLLESNNISFSFSFSFLLRLS